MFLNPHISQAFHKIKKILFLFLIYHLPFTIHHSFATHIVGNVLTYKYNGGNSYTITLKAFRDCGAGHADLQDPETIFVRGFDGLEFTPNRNISIPLISETPVPSPLDSCAIPPNPAGRDLQSRPTEQRICNPKTNKDWRTNPIQQTQAHNC